jgi:hypothetical protein
MRRYMRHLSQSELNRRIRDIFLNLLYLTRDAKIGVPPIDADFAIWIEKWTHVLEEMQLRHGPYPSGFTREILHSEPFPNFASELAERAARKMSSLGLRNGDVFIKFGQRAYMEALHERGALRIQPAHFFSDKDHTGAIRDDELTLPISIALSRDDVVKLVRNPQDVPPNASEQRVDIRITRATDYWLYCVTSSIEPRLFVDFNADACLIIRDRATFTRMLRQASALHLTNATMNEGPVQYIDPLFPKSTRVFVPLAKHFAHSYQEEYRFCWRPPVPIKKLSSRDIEIGSLRDVTELVVL